MSSSTEVGGSEAGPLPLGFLEVLREDEPARIERKSARSSVIAATPRPQVRTSSVVIVQECRYVTSIQRMGASFARIHNLLVSAREPVQVGEVKPFSIRPQADVMTLLPALSTGIWRAIGAIRRSLRTFHWAASRFTVRVPWPLGSASA